MSWFSLARYANWNHFNRPKGLEVIGVTEGNSSVGAYDTSRFDEFVKKESNVVNKDLFVRNKRAKYFIPNDDEWYKAAYYDPKRPGFRKYWNFPNRSNLPPNNKIHSPGSANYQVEILGEGSPYYVSKAGNFKSTGYFKVNDLGGNLWEWVEDWRGLGGEKCWRCDIPTKGLRGGSFNYISTGLLNSNVDPGFPSDHYFVYGGRLARHIDDRPGLINECVPLRYRKAAIRRLKLIIDKVAE
jgi:formylglycine-generating enzyme required for sulfatase activity